MSRMGDTIRASRVKYGLTEKQLAKKTGLAESFVKEVELGKRIPSDDQARRMLKACGVTQEDTSPETVIEPETPLRPRPRPYTLPQAVKKEEAPETEAPAQGSNEAWLDALGGVVKRVPVMDDNALVIDHVLFPVTGGRIEGGQADKVVLFRVQDESLAGFAIHAGDLMLTVPEKQPVDDAFMLLAYHGRHCVRRIKKLEGSKLMLQSYDRELKIDTVMWGEIQILGRCVKLIRSL